MNRPHNESTLETLAALVGRADSVLVPLRHGARDGHGAAIPDLAKNLDAGLDAIEEAAGIVRRLRAHRVSVPEVRTCPSDYPPMTTLETNLEELARLTARSDAALVAATSGFGRDGNPVPLPDLAQNLVRALQDIVLAGRIAKSVIDQLGTGASKT